LDNPLDEVRPSYTVFPDVCAAASRRTAPLLGFFASSALEEKRVHVHLAVALRLPGVADGSRTAGYGVARRFSQPLSDFFLSPPSRHFQAGGALGVPPYRGLVPPRSPDDSSSPAYPLGLCPADCASSRPRRERPGASPPTPRIDGVAPLWPSGFLSSWKSVRVTKSRLMSE